MIQVNQLPVPNTPESLDKAQPPSIQPYETSHDDPIDKHAQSDIQPYETSQDDPPNHAQPGVQQIEAIATVWSPTTLITAYILIWIVYFTTLTQQAAASSLNPYVTSAFQHHSLTPTVGILSSVIGGVCNLTVAKVLDVFGRPQGYAASLLVATVGLVMMAATTTVEMYAAAQVFFTVGNNALLYSVNIFVADTTRLRNRGLMTALTASPNIITTWLGGPISEAFLKGPGWRWCFGAFSIIVPVMCLPLFVLLVMNYSKAKREGIIAPNTRPRTPWQSFLYYCREFDAVGLLLLTAGLALFLLPFNLYTLQPLGWKSPLIICLLVFGVALIVGFALWEKFFASVTFIPFSLLLDRNMVGACILGAVLFISFYCWNSFFSSFLQVVNGLSVAEASYVVQIYGLGSSLFAIATGVAIRYTGRFKAITVYGAIPLYTLFMGLMIYFRQADMSIGYIVMCQIFISFAAGVIIITPQIAAMSAASHQHIAAVMAIISMFSSVGGAIGLTVAGAIWQSVFPVKLAEYLPVEEQANFVNIYAMLDVQLSYPIGTPARIAIQRAYADAQSMMLTAGTAIWVVGFVAVAFWRNTDVRDLKQVKGQVI
ncbi:Siderophore iron transporter mirB [Neonectria ditissima]|uniref:Siderophore iron transporter mirB n=1 Tax=Neonectria ditissima TaxID=78410 RepID=A0A0P7B2F9_9HYPO|nr:Siderophore iron transporter mirB [Neonectria ditissima]